MWGIWPHGTSAVYLWNNYREPPMNIKTKIETLIKNKFKSSPIVKLDSSYAEGVVTIKKVNVSTLSNGLPYTLEIEVQFQGETKGGSWLSAQYKGRRRNNEITSRICWQENDMKLLSRVFGIRYIEVKKITVKKK
jgi:hypothetical protein